MGGHKGNSSKIRPKFAAKKPGEQKVGLCGSSAIRCPHGVRKKRSRGEEVAKKVVRGVKRRPKRMLGHGEGRRGGGQTTYKRSSGGPKASSGNRQTKGGGKKNVNCGHKKKFIEAGGRGRKLGWLGDSFSRSTGQKEPDQGRSGKNRLGVPRPSQEKASIKRGELDTIPDLEPCFEF